MQFHHIGIFVKDLDYGIAEISKFVNIASFSDTVEDHGIGVKIQFLQDHSKIIYELVAPFGANSPVTGVLARGTNHLNHIAYTTSKFDEEMKRLRAEGMVPLGPPKNAKAFNDSRVMFFLSPLKFIIEIIEQRDDI